MPEKYHIETKPAPPRFTPVGKYAIIDLYEECARGCKKCVKRKCVYKNYDHETDFVRDLVDRPLEFMNDCMNCLMCVQNCTKGALTRIVNPEFRWLGDDYWKPDQILSIWKQAATGSIPVSGAGYGGPFAGPGFDSMWTDMSEIVRPTRDGIHGREYISTSVDVGAKPFHLAFDPDGSPLTEQPPLIEIPVPFMMQKPPFGYLSVNVYLAMARAAAGMGTFLVLPADEITPELDEYKDSIVARIPGGGVDKYRSLVEGAKLVEIEDSPGAMDDIKKIKDISPQAIVILRKKLELNIEDDIVALAENGVEVVHLFADSHGNVSNGGETEFLKDVIRSIHDRLVDKSLRDMITIVASGGIAMAEHMAKAIICGADFVMLGQPFMLAMECRMCRNCSRDIECPVDMANIPPEHGADRITNLAASWRNQFLEVLGAMGIREVRRLRGEVGRAMFIEDLERETFEKIFAKKEASV
ncbi:glutamate synthase-related protein [bacterium]